MSKQRRLQIVSLKNFGKGEGWGEAKNQRPRRAKAKKEKWVTFPGGQGEGLVIITSTASPYKLIPWEGKRGGGGGGAWRVANSGWEFGAEPGFGNYSSCRGTPGDAWRKGSNQTYKNEHGRRKWSPIRFRKKVINTKVRRLTRRGGKSKRKSGLTQANKNLHGKVILGWKKKYGENGREGKLRGKGQFWCWEGRQKVA